MSRNSNRKTCLGSWGGEKPRFPVWNTVRVGHMTLDAYLKKIGPQGHCALVNGWCEQILRMVPLSPRRHELDLVAPSVAELGFEKGGTRREVFASGIHAGLRQSPAETSLALALRSNRADHLDVEWMRLAMDSLVDQEGDLVVLGVARPDNDPGWALGYDGHPDSFLFPQIRLVFVKPRKRML